MTVGGNVLTDAGRLVIVRYDDGCHCFQVAQTITQLDTPGAGPAAERFFASTLSRGELDGDASADLAVGVPDQDTSAGPAAGIVNVFYGGPGALQLNSVQTIQAGVDGVAGTPGAGDIMGTALATGDFDGDGIADLAIGAPGRTTGGASHAGEVLVLRGSQGSGITTTGQQLLSEAGLNGEGVAEPNAAFGHALAAGRFSHGGNCLRVACFADLAIGVPLKTVNGQTYAGEVVVARGGVGSIQIYGGTILTVSGGGLAPATGDQFGLVLAAGSVADSPGFLGFRLADLAVGAPGRALEDGAKGLVELFFGDAEGIGAGAPPEPIDGRGLGMPRGPVDDWGMALAITDVDGDGIGDLVVGAPGATVGGVSGRGAVEVMFGALFADGFETGGTSHWSFRSP